MKLKAPGILPDTLRLESKRSEWLIWGAFVLLSEQQHPPRDSQGLSAWCPSQGHPSSQAFNSHSFRVKGAEERGSVSTLQADCPPSFSHHSQRTGGEDEKGKGRGQGRHLCPEKSARQPPRRPGGQSRCSLELCSLFLGPQPSHPPRLTPSSVPPRLPFHLIRQCNCVVLSFVGGLFSDPQLGFTDIRTP